MKAKIGIIARVAFAALMLAACGDNGGTSAAPSNADQIVASFEDLAQCTAKREGAFAYVRDQKTEYVCADGDWIPASDRNPNISYGTMTDGRDNKTYRTVVIGSQTWMAEKLNYEYKVNGSTFGNWCYYDSDRYCSKLGRLYTWAAAMDSSTTGCGRGKKCAAQTGRVQGVCPDGWHLPSYAEWETLFAAVGGESVAGTALKTRSGWGNNGSESGNGSDAYGFAALPSGYRNGGDYYYLDSAAYFWSSSDSAGAPYIMNLAYDRADAKLFSAPSYIGFVVRCLKD